MTKSIRHPSPPRGAPWTVRRSSQPPCNSSMTRVCAVSRCAVWAPGSASRRWPCTATSTAGKRCSTASSSTSSTTSTPTRDPVHRPGLAGLPGPGWPTACDGSRCPTPQVFPLIATRPPAAPWLRPPLRSLRWMESFLSTLHSCGFADDAAVAAYRGFSSFLLGHLLLEVSALGRRHRPDRPGLAGRRHTHRPLGLPGTGGTGAVALAGPVRRGVPDVPGLAVGPIAGPATGQHLSSAARLCCPPADGAPTGRHLPGDSTGRHLTLRSTFHHRTAHDRAIMGGNYSWPGRRSADQGPVTYHFRT